LQRQNNSEREQMEQLSKLGLSPEIIDLRNYFNKQKELEEKIKKYQELLPKISNV
jgi:hypothetical protein